MYPEISEDEVQIGDLCSHSSNEPQGEYDVQWIYMGRGVGIDQGWLWKRWDRKKEIVEDCSFGQWFLINPIKKNYEEKIISETFEGRCKIVKSIIKKGKK